CMNNSSKQLATFVENGCFCVNVLREDAVDIAGVFSGKIQDMDQRYATAEWETITTGAPVLSASLVSCDCKIVDRQIVGTHSVFLGYIVGQRLRVAGRSLLYFDRNFGHFRTA